MAARPADAATPAASAWRNVPVPQSLPNARMSGASLASANSGWGVGNQSATGGLDQPAIWRWIKSGWQLVTPSLPGNSDLSTVGAVPGRAWAAGQDASQPGPATGLNLFWNGATWRRAASRDLLFGIAAAGHSAWAIGLTGSSGNLVSSILRWNGSDWVVARQPPGATLQAIQATSPTDVWAGGNDANGNGVAFHFNGSSWRRLKVPVPGGLDKIAVGSANNVWVAGGLGVVHFNGTAWSRFPLPWAGPFGAGTMAVDASGAPWLTVTTSLVANRSQYFRLAGKRWIQQLGPVHPLAIGMNTQSLTRVPGTCTLLGTGWAQVFDKPFPALSEVNPSAGCPAARALATGAALSAGTAAGPVPASARATGTAPAWQVSQVPGAVQPLAGLNDVAAAGPHAAWAVGFDLKGTLAPGDPLILSWNGTRWRDDPLPGITWSGGLTAVSGDSARDAWAVGQGNPLLAAGQLPRLLHWNGRNWRNMAFPGMTRATTQLSGVAAVSPKLAWITGSGPGGAPMMLRWNGTSVQQVTLPITTGTLNNVRAGGASDAWAVGSQPTSSGTEPIVLHWDGTAWHVLPAPSLSAPQAGFTDVLPGPGGTAWAVGEQSPNGFAPNFLLEHWDGTTWTQVALPVNPIGTLTSITADRQGNPEWIGAFDLGGTPTLYLHNNGTAWQAVTGPVLPNVNSGKVFIAHVPGTAITLAAGTAGLTVPSQGQVYDVPLLEQAG